MSEQETEITVTTTETGTVDGPDEPGDGSPEINHDDDAIETVTETVTERTESQR